ncbi:hypothetical protein GYH30_026454 [Glycine max]|nr:hypothetical protein GYH30_026454 [Glycine max]KAH1045271.1 hypothetical protein GYH30_026454 [Glycine max]
MIAFLSGIYSYNELFSCSLLSIIVFPIIASKAHELAHYHSGDEDGIYLAYSKQLDTFTQVF